MDNVKVNFELEVDEYGFPPIGIETLNGVLQENGLVKIDNTPFFVEGIVSGDSILLIRKSALPLKNSILSTFPTFQSRLVWLWVIWLCTVGEQHEIFGKDGRAQGYGVGGMNLFIRIIIIIFGVVLASMILSFLNIAVSSSVLLLVVLAIIGGVIWLLFRSLFLIFERLRHRKITHKKTIIASTLILFVALTWVPWWQYMFLSVESLSQKNKLNTAPMFWRFFTRGQYQTTEFVRNIINTHFENKKNVQELIKYLERSGFNCRKFKYVQGNKSPGTACQSTYVLPAYVRTWYVFIYHEDNLVSKIKVSQYVDSI